MAFSFFRRAPARAERAQAAVITSKDLAEVIFGTAMSASGVVVTPAQAMGIAAVQAAVRVIAETMGQLPCVLFEEYQPQHKRLAKDHPLWQLLRYKPNDWMTWQEFVETMTALMCIYGAAFAYKNKVRNNIVELIPIHPSRVIVEQTKDLQIIFHVTLASGEIKDFGLDQIFYLRDMSLDGFTGASRVKMCRDALGLAKAAEQYGGDFFANSARPTGLLSTTIPLRDQEEADKVRESWTKGDGEKRLGTKVLSGPWQWTAISQTADEAQFLETRKFQILEVSRIFRVPPHMVSDLERATFSNIEQQGIDFVKYSFMPWARRWEMGIDTQLLSDKDRQTIYSRVKTDSLMRGDSAARSNYYTKMVASKILNPNECRLEEDLNPYEGGDDYSNPAITVGTTIALDTETVDEGMDNEE